MPEGDTVFRVAEYLRERLINRPVREVRLGAGLKVGLGCEPGAGSAFLGRLAGRRVAEVSTHGKHLWIRFEGELAVRSHLGLHGSWHRYGPSEPWRKPERRASLVLRTDEDVLVCFDAREVECLPGGASVRSGVEAGLGPDLSRAGVDATALPARSRALLPGEALLVDVLLDQRIAAGIGNVYKSEVLFLEGVSPFARLADVSDADLRGLFATAADLLGKNLGAGPRTTRFAADGRGRLWVYGRAGRPCLRCGALIRCRRAGRGLRSTYWCPSCQKG